MCEIAGLFICNLCIQNESAHDESIKYLLCLPTLNVKRYVATEG